MSSSTRGVPAIDGNATSVEGDQHAVLALQRGLLVSNRDEPGSGVGLLQVVVEIPEPLDTEAMTIAWQHAARRHAILRTAFARQPDKTLVQRIAPTAEVPVTCLDGSALDHGCERFRTVDPSREFDIGRPPLVRVALVRQAPQRYTMVLSAHHAILDDRSLHLLLTEVFAEYAALRNGATYQAPPRRPFQDFVAWAAARDPGVDRQFWRSRLAGLSLPTALPLRAESSAPPDRPASVREISATVDAATAQALSAAAQACGVPLSTLTTAAWAVLLHRYSGADQVVFGAVRSCRHGTIDGAGQIVGMMINTLPMRIDVAPDRLVRDWLVDVRAQLDGTRAHQLAPLPDIRQWAGLPPTTSLFDSTLRYEHRDLQSALAATVPDWGERTAQVHRQPSTPVTVCVYGGPVLRIVLQHDRHRLAEDAADRMLRHLTTCLTGIATGLDAPVAALPLLSPAELRQLTAEWASGAPPGPTDATIAERFAEQVRGAPDAIAVTGPDGTLTYAELDAQANRLARLLVGRGVGTDTPVAVAVPRSVRLVVALLAVVKAGGAYLPIDPADPPARTRRILATAGDPLALTVSGRTGLPDGYPALRLDTMDAELAALPPSAVPCPAHPDSLAYLSHTSGSTGEPKGVAVPHRAVLRLVQRPDYLRLGPDETVLQLAPVAFDAATLEIWGSLLTGARLVLAPSGVTAGEAERGEGSDHLAAPAAAPVGPDELARLLRTEQISVLWLTAGLFHQVVERDPSCLAGVGQVLAGGDVLAPDAVRTVLRTRPGQPLVNGYGPTENTTFTCCHRMTDPATVGESVPIGRPVPGTTVYVLDQRLRPVPVGVPGELYTGGDGLARGYLGRPALTASRFVADPFSDRPGARMYRTGDRVRWRSDGTLEFLGRVDRQVKIRGFRVEPAEVEAVLRAHPQVGEVVVTVDGTGERRRLVAYLTATAGAAPPAPTELARYAAERLPPHLRPAGYLVLPTMPLNRNGKVDRAQLPPPNAVVPIGQSADHAEPPLTDPVQVELAAIWSDLLDVAVSRASDDFFELGGNSLLATRLAFLAADRFGVDLPVQAVYDRRGLAALAAEIDRRRGAGRGTTTITARDRSAYRQPDEPTGHVSPTPGPWRLWRWVGLRAAGFSVDPLIRLGDPTHLAVTDTLLDSEDRVERTRRALIDRLHRARRAAPADQRSRWNRAERQVRRGDLPDPMPDDPELSRLRADFAEALRRLAADQAAFARSHQRAADRRSAELRSAAADPRFREAVTWQNRHALRTGVDPLLSGAAHGSKHRQHEALVATYLQRYCAKNDTIGFFGPVGWATVTADRPAAGDPPLRIRHGATPLATRTVYFENWAVSELADALAQREPALRPSLVPRRLPYLSIVGDQLHQPLTPPTTLPAAQARLLAACDGTRSAGEIAADLVADPTVPVRTPEEVYRLLAELRDARRVTWSLEVPKEDLRPERAVRDRLSAVPDPAASAPALAALDELESARDAVAAAAGDPERLDAALGTLERTFTSLTGATPTRRAGGVYAGRTLVYEDCRSSTQVELSPALLGTLWPVLSLLLESARWFTFAGAALFRRACAERYRELAARHGRAEVPFADFWLWANDILFDLPEKLIAPVVRGLQERWATILPDLTGQRRVQVELAAVEDRVRAAFAAPRPGWVGAYQHSPDVMLAANGVDAITRGDYHWVVGEVHPGVNTLRSALFVAQHPRPQELLAATAADLPGPRVVLAATGEEGAAPSRLTDKLITDRDLRLVFGHDSAGFDPRSSLAVADADLLDRNGTLLVRSRDGRFELPLSEVVGEALMLQLLQRFDPLSPAAHRPRITVDRVVIARESWRFRAADLDFAQSADEADRFRRVRRWQRERGLPRYVFVTTPVERKPFFVDFASLAAVDGFARAVRRTTTGAGDAAVLRLTEMLPDPEQLWLTSADGGRHTAEFRLVAVDTRVPPDAADRTEATRRKRAS